jgi:uncharacterized membrane protein
MLTVLAVFIILIIYDLQKFIRKKEPVRVFVLYFFFMAAGFTVSLLLAAGKRPYSPTQMIEAVFKMIGIVK